MLCSQQITQKIISTQTRLPAVKDLPLNIQKNTQQLNQPDILQINSGEKRSSNQENIQLLPQNVPQIKIPNIPPILPPLPKHLPMLPENAAQINIPNLPPIPPQLPRNICEDIIEPEKKQKKERCMESRTP